MNKTKITIATVCLSIIAVASIVFIACNDEEETKKVAPAKSATFEQELIEIFNSGEIAEFTTREFNDYIYTVSDYYGIDIEEMAQEDFFDRFDTIKFRSCLMKAVKNGTITSQQVDRVQEISDSLNTALNNDDSLLAKKLCLEYYNLFNCSSYSTFDNLPTGNDNSLVAMSNGAKMVFDSITAYSPNIRKLSDEELQFVIGLANYAHMIYKQLDSITAIPYKTAPVKCSTCENIRNVATSVAIAEYLYNSAKCVTLVNPIAFAACLTIESAFLVAKEYVINEDYKICIANCVN